MSVKEIETAIAQFAPDELAELTDWFNEFRARNGKECLLPEEQMMEDAAEEAHLLAEIDKVTSIINNRLERMNHLVEDTAEQLKEARRSLKEQPQE